MIASIPFIYAFCVATMTVYSASAAPVAGPYASESAYTGLDFGVAGDGFIVQLKPHITAARHEVKRTEPDIQHMWIGSVPEETDGLKPKDVERQDYDSLPGLRSEFGSIGHFGTLSSSHSTLFNDVKDDLHLKRQQDSLGKRNTEISSPERRLHESGIGNLGFGTWGNGDAWRRGSMDDSVQLGTIAASPVIADDDA